MASIYDNRQRTTFAPSELASPSGPVGGPSSANLHPSASSSGQDPSLGFGPVLTPEQQAAFAQTMGGVVYSLGAGGYGSSLNPWTGKPPTAADMDANSAYMKFGPLNANSDFIKRGIPDAAANKRVGDLFAGLGAMPTAPNLTPSAQLLANQVPGGYKPDLGPSINERLGHPWQGPWAF